MANHSEYRSIYKARLLLTRSANRFTAVSAVRSTFYVEPQWARTERVRAFLKCNLDDQR